MCPFLLLHIWTFENKSSVTDKLVSSVEISYTITKMLPLCPCNLLCIKWAQYRFPCTLSPTSAYLPVTLPLLVPRSAEEKHVIFCQMFLFHRKTHTASQLDQEPPSRQHHCTHSLLLHHPSQILPLWRINSIAKYANSGNDGVSEKESGSLGGAGEASTMVLVLFSKYVKYL